ncbi:MAG TPA: AsmA-like C-terminal region-containing protein [Gemmataceae bacterium]|nr:AsmA-like C-terminal region-containing protein [Gemmataceae bacterium]
MAAINPSSQLAPPRRWRKLRRFLIFAAFASFVFFLPEIVAASGMLNWALSKNAPGLRGSVQVGHASLGWLWPVDLRDVVIRDEQGNSVAEIPQISGAKSLFALMCNRRDLGEWTVDQPSVHVVCQKDTTNLETVLEPLISGPSSGRPLDLHVIVRDGTIEINDADTQRQWKLAKVQGTVHVTRDAGAPMQILAESAKMETSQVGNLSADLKIGLSATGNMPTMNGKIVAQQFPLDLAEPFVRRFEPALHLFGLLSGNLDVQADSAEQMSVNGRIQAQQFEVADTARIADVVQLRKLDAPFSLSVTNGIVQAQKLEITTDAGHLVVQGSFDPAKNYWTWLNQAGATISADVDLAQVARVLPNTLHLHKDLQITSGRLQANLTSQANGTDVTWQGKIETSDLQARQNGQVLSWQQPLIVDVAARTVANQLPVIDRLHCDSEFLKIDVTRAAERFQATATYDLTKLRQQLSRFIDLGSFGLDGQGTATLSITPQPQDKYQIEGNANIHALNLTGPGGQRWQEPEVSLKYIAIVQPGEKINIPAASGTLQAGQDWLWMQSTEAATDLLGRPSFGAKVRLYGELSRWRNRAGPWLQQLAALPLIGAGELSGQVKFTPESIAFRDVIANYQNFGLNGAFAKVVEPTFVLTTTGSRDNKTGSIHLGATQLSANTLSAKFTSLDVGFDANGKPLVNGQGTIQGELARLERWLVDPKDAGNMAGAFSGSISCKAEQGESSLAIELVTLNPVIGPITSPYWKESKVTVSASGKYDPQSDNLTLDKLRIDSPSAQANGQGQIQQVTGKPVIDLSGKLDYDDVTFQPLLQSNISKTATATGRGSTPFHIQGPLASFPNQLSGDMNLGWQSLQAFGAVAGPAVVEMHMKNGEVTAPPVYTTLNQGKLTMVPRLKLSPTVLSFSKGTELDHAKLTQQMGDELLSYISPALARAEDINGEVSMVVDDGSRMPLMAVEKMEASGRITMHSVTIQGGPMIRVLALLTRNKSSVALQKEAVVNFRVTKGRIYHDKMELYFPDMMIRTSGSVGFDDTLDLMVDMTVPPKWLPAGPARDSLAKQPLRVPIKGTLSQPQVDQKAFEQQIATMIRNAAGNTIRDEIKKGIGEELQNLFPKK